MRRRTHVLAAVALGVALLGSTGCTQVAQLRGVAGGDINAVRTATNDVLVTKGVNVRVAPVCQNDGTAYTCEGTTADGAAISARAVARTEYGATTDEWGAYVPADVSLVVTVGGATIYDGTVEDVLHSSGQVTP